MAKDRSSPPNLDALEKALAYSFTDRSFLERAITHRSWAYEQIGPGEDEKVRLLHNEAFEFLGDSVLGLIIAASLFSSYPNVTEGELSRMKHRLVSTQTLTRAAKRIGIGEYLRFGRGEEKTGGRRKGALLADAFEAVLAAIYLDGGIDAAAEFVQGMLSQELDEMDPDAAAAADYKTMLQERLQAEHRTTPQYNVTETQGPPHHRVFRVEVNWEGGQVQGQGRTIKAAEIDAARRALERMSAPLPAEATKETTVSRQKTESSGQKAQSSEH